MLMAGGRSLEDSLSFLINQKGANTIVTKMGGRGCHLAVADKRVSFPSFSIEVKDTTGAGDSFNAGVVMARLVGLSWEASAALGNAMGGMATAQDGAGAVFHNRSAVAKLIEKHIFKDDWFSVRLALEELTVYFEGML